MIDLYVEKQRSGMMNGTDPVTFREIGVVMACVLRNRDKTEAEQKRSGGGTEKRSGHC